MAVIRLLPSVIRLLGPVILLLGPVIRLLPPVIQQQSEDEEEYAVDESIKQQHSEEMKNIKDDDDFEFTFAFEFIHQLFFTNFPHFKPPRY